MTATLAAASMRSTVIGLALVLAPCCPATPACTGTWVLERPRDAGGRLETRQSGDRVRFQLELSRGAPTYNSGFIEGEFVLEARSGVFRTTEFGVCELHFVFEDAAVRIEQVGGECGFGYGVDASGTYTLRRTSAPVPSDEDAPPDSKELRIESEVPAGTCRQSSSPAHPSSDRRHSPHVDPPSTVPR